MNKKVIAGAVIALAAGIAAFIYNRKRDRINESAADLYNATKDSVSDLGRDIEHSFS